MRVRGWWSGAWPTRRSRAFDIAIALSFAVGDGVFLWFADQKFWLPPPVVSACSVVLGLALIVRRSHPVGLTVFAVVFGTVTGAGAFSTLIVLYSLAAYTASRRTVVIIAVTGYVASLVFPAPTAATESFLAQSIFGIAFVGVPVLLGLYMGARKQLLASLQERAARLEREQHLLAERARGGTHPHRAGDARRRRQPRQRDGRPRRRAEGDRRPRPGAGRRDRLGHRRHGAAGAGGAPPCRRGAPAGEEALPQQVVTLAHLRELVGQSGAAGLRVDLTIRGEERPMPAAVGRTVYRLVQEALTNVHKHAGAADTRVDLGLLPEAVEVEIANEPPTAAPEHRLPSGGNGLVGLRERVTALGGSFDAGPRGGGYAVRARLPLPAS